MFLRKPIVNSYHQLVVVTWLLTLSWFVGETPVLLAETSGPNIVLIFCDNLGYGDVGCFGLDRTFARVAVLAY